MRDLRATIASLSGLYEGRLDEERLEEGRDAKKAMAQMTPAEADAPVSKGSRGRVADLAAKHLAAQVALNKLLDALRDYSDEDVPGTIPWSANKSQAAASVLRLYLLGVRSQLAGSASELPPLKAGDRSIRTILDGFRRSKGR